MKPRHLVPFMVLFMCCDRPPANRPAPAPPDPLGQGRTLLQQGQLDAALAQLQEVPLGAESLYLQGMVWARKAQAAPPPTPPPPPPTGRPGEKTPPPPEFKDEELKAIGFFEAALAQNLDYSPAHLALADLLAPRAERLFDAQQEAAKRRGHRAAPPNLSEEGPDYSPERVLQAYQDAVRTAPMVSEPVEGLIRFSVRVRRLEEANAAYLELLKRNPEKPEPLIRYADFLAQEMQDPQGAIDRYREAMIWRPDDQQALLKIAELYIRRGEEHFARKENVPAEKNFLEAKKYITDWTSPQGRKVQEYLEKFRRRGR